MEGLLNSIYEEIQHSCKDDISLMFEMIRKSIIRLKNTITDLSDISKIQSINKKEALEQVDLIELIEEFKSDYAKEIQISKTVIELKLEVEKIPFSKKNLRSVLYNLLSNAIKYRKPDENPVIKIRTMLLKTDCILLTIADNGLGIDTIYKDKIFGMFKRLHSHVEGSGIGLYIVKKIMENAGGRINFHSRVGKGTMFKLYFEKD